MNSPDSASSSSFEPAINWREAALRGCRSPGEVVECPACSARALSAAWNLVDLASREAVVELRCSTCSANHSLRMELPAEAPPFYPAQRVESLAALVEKQLAEVAGRIRRQLEPIPAAAFTLDPLWAEARWSATTFQWHPTSQAPPIMGIVFENAAAGRELFRRLVARIGNVDRLEEIRVSIIEGEVPNQRRGYTVHLCPDPHHLTARAATEGIALDPHVALLLGQWNRMYPTPESAGLLPRFKKEYQKHAEFLLAPVTRRADGRLWADVELGVIKKTIHFRELSQIGPGDVDVGALVLPLLVTPAEGR